MLKRSFTSGICRGKHVRDLTKSSESTPSILHSTRRVSVYHFHHNYFFRDNSIVPPDAMPITLKGSCHCGTVRFMVESSTPIPYQVSITSITVMNLMVLPWPLTDKVMCMFHMPQSWRCRRIDQSRCTFQDSGYHPR